MVDSLKKKQFLRFLYHWVSPLWDPIAFFKALIKYPNFLMDLAKYSIKDAKPIRIIDTYPLLFDKTKTTPFSNRHYFYQDIWAFKKIYESKVKNHVDVGSKIDFVGFLTAFTKVHFVDIRPLEANLENFNSMGGNILSLPFADDSICSLSCLHVAEHIGLGRYGDSLNPLGTKKACQELARVLKVNGNLYFSVPVGKPKVCFNAHRIHAPSQILSYFHNLGLVEFSGIDDEGNFRENISPGVLKNSDCACGLFWFRKQK